MLGLARKRGARGSEPGIGVGHGTGNVLRQCRRVGLRHRPVAADEIVKRRLARKHRTGMRVGGGDHHVRAGDGGLFFDEPARLDDRMARQADEIADDERDFGVAIIEHGGLGENIVHHPRAATLVVVTRHRCAVGRIDDDGAGADPEIGGVKRKN